MGAALADLGTGEGSQGKALRRARRRLAKGESITNVARSFADGGTGPGQRAEQWKDLHARQWGMSPELWELLSEPGVTDVLINGTQTWVDRGQGCQLAGWAPESETECRLLATHMAAAAGRRLDDASPLADAFLGQQYRLHAVIPPLSRESTAISLRVLRPRGFSLKELVRLGTVTEDAEPLLRAIVSRRVSALISGATGSGKTTLLGALLGLVPADQRIICIEEVSELYPDHPHVLHLQERQPNIEGSGSVTLTQLVRAALRMRPDRLILGECRGPEIREVLTAMNTGHAGGFATIHAGSVAGIASRLIALGSLAGMSPNSVRAHAVAAFQVVLQLGRTADGGRRLMEVGVLDGDKELKGISAWDCRSDESRPGPGWDQLRRVLGGDW